jgi:hypothetical protein
MAQSYTTDDGITLIDPGTYVSLAVLQGVSQTASAGVVTLIGEADQGPGFLDEADLSQVYYTPDQFNKILAKYGSGNIVDGASKLIAAANDPNILGAVSLIRIVKTNMSSAAQGSITQREQASPVYAVGSALKQGAPGNLIQWQSEVAIPESAPATGLFAYAPAISGSPISLGIRVNGGALNSVSITNKLAPDALVSSLSNVAAGILVNGGNKKSVSTSGLSLTAAPLSTSVLQVTLASGNLWSNAPVVGDVAVIPAASDYGAAQLSCLAGAGSANVGTYIVTAVSNTVTSATLTLQKVATSGALVAATGSTHSDDSDLILYSQINIQNITGSTRDFMLGVYGTYNVTLNTGTSIQIQTPASTVWNAIPQAGDIITVPAAFSTVQPGFYQVTAGTSTTVTATRLSEGSSGTGTGTQAYSSGAEPIQLLQAVVQGAGKSLSFEGIVDSVFLNSSGQAQGLSNTQLVSAAEQISQLTVLQGVNYSKSYQGGGQVVLEVGCTSNNASVVVGPSDVQFKVGATVAFTCTFKQFLIMSDLVSYINSQTGWEASLGSARYSSLSPASLDQGTYACSSTLPGILNGRIKNDASSWQSAVNQDGLVNWTVQMPGLPEATPSFQFLHGGARNGTTSASVVAAIDACQRLTTNFIVTLFSQDATKDIADELTDSSSTYTIDAINAYLSSHVIFMSQIEMRSNRQAFGSKQDTYANIKEEAGSIANYRFALSMQPVKGQTSDGTPTMFQPWMSSIVAAGMQAAAGYKGIVKKFANIQGLGTVSGWDASSPGDRKDALKTGILFMQAVPTGGFRWVSDQTTYSVDNNFVYNSVQAIYISDLITLSLIDTFDRQVDGKSVAEISAQAALSILDASMFNFKRLRWIATSDDAPKGYKNASAQIQGPALILRAEIKLAGLIYFVPISLLVSQVQQSAS